jgi:NAD(P)-dependent dehydrogenase (short-subunit alcohol dehydrogenase family)
MLVLNAGGMGSDDHLTLTSDGITKVMAINTTGHAAFFEGLLAGSKLANDAKIIFTGSEIARGMTGMARKPSFTSHDAECITTHIVGNPSCSYARTPSFMSVMSSYAAAKAVGTLYFQQCARENPAMTIYSVSPGSCYGTNAHLGAPGKMQMTNVPLQMRMMSFLGLAQSSAVGAKRNLDALFGRGPVYPSGTFIASRGWATGETCDQAESHADIFANESLQLAAAQAVRKSIS